MESQNPQYNTLNPNIMFTTTDAKADFDRLKEAGVDVFEFIEMPYGTMFQFKDLEGNLFAVRQD